MGITYAHALGEQRVVFVTTQPTSATVKPASNDAVKVLKCDLGFERARDKRDDNKSTRSVLEQITGKEQITWLVEKYLIPSGTAGTPPDDHLLWKAVMGGYTNTPSTSDVYSLTNTQSLDMVSIFQNFPGVLGEGASRCITDEMSLSITGGDRPKVKFSGFAMNHAHAGTSTLASAMGGTAEMEVQAADAWQFEVGSLISVGSNDNMMVIVDSLRPTFTLDDSITASISDPVVPYVPTESTSGDVLPSIIGDFIIDSTTIPITKFDLTVKNNDKPVDDEAFSIGVTDAIPDDRDVTGSLGIRARKDLITYLTARKSFVTQDLQIVVGGTSGKKIQIDIDYAEMKFSPITAPQSGEVMIELPFVAIGSSGEDEAVITFF